MIEILLYVIIYPLAIELFAFQNDRWPMCIQTQIRYWKRWTTADRKRGCKNFFDHYNATPSLEATIGGSEALKSDLIIFDCVCGLLALINFCMAPLTCYTIPNQVFSELPFIKVKKLRQSQAMSLYK